MSPYLLLSFVLGYFILLFVVAWYTSRNANNDSFFIGNKNSNWKLVAFGMIGISAYAFKDVHRARDVVGAHTVPVIVTLFARLDAASALIRDAPIAEQPSVAIGDDVHRRHAQHATLKERMPRAFAIMDSIRMQGVFYVGNVTAADFTLDAILN